MYKLQSLAASGKVDALENALNSENVNVLEKDSRLGRTVLHYAAGYGNKETF